MAAKIDRAWLQDQTFIEAVSSLTRGPESDLDEAFARLLEYVSAAAIPGPEVSRFLDLAASLITSTLLWYPVDRAAVDGRTIAKVAWPDKNTDTYWVRASRSMSWSHPTEWMALPHAGDEANFHLEIEAPSPLLIRNIKPPPFWWIRPLDRDGGGVGDASVDAERSNLRPEQHVACHNNLAHAYASGPRPGTADIEFCLAPPRNGFVGASFAASLLIALFVTVVFVSRTHMADPSNRDVGRQRDTCGPTRTRERH